MSDEEVPTIGPLSSSVPRHGWPERREWRNELLPAYKRLSRRAEALIAEGYLAGINTRRAHRALVRLCESRIGKNIVSRALHRYPRLQRPKGAARQDDNKAAAISLLPVALGSRRDGHTVVLVGEDEDLHPAIAPSPFRSGRNTRPQVITITGFDDHLRLDLISPHF